MNSNDWKKVIDHLVEADLKNREKKIKESTEVPKIEDEKRVFYIDVDGLTNGDAIKKIEKFKEKKALELKRVNTLIRDLKEKFTDLGFVIEDNSMGEYLLSVLETNYIITHIIKHEYSHVRNNLRESLFSSIRILIDSVDKDLKEDLPVEDLKVTAFWTGKVINLNTKRGKFKLKTKASAPKETPVYVIKDKTKGVFNVFLKALPEVPIEIVSISKSIKKIHYEFEEIWKK